jgi:adenylate kinase
MKQLTTVMSKIIVLIGAPGAGKGTQARILQERKGWPQVSTGDMFRALKNADTPLAREVQAIMAAGQLVSDDLTVRIVEERANQPDCAGGYILDGFPRTAPQAEKLEDLAAAQGKQIQAVLVDAPLDVLEKRLTGRRSCPVCGEIYNVYFKPPQVEGRCDAHPEAALDHRKDDTVETVKQRLATYEAQTRPLLDYYAASNRLQSVDGTRSLEEVYADLERAVAGD